MTLAQTITYRGTAAAYRRLTAAIRANDARAIRHAYGRLAALDLAATAAAAR